MSGSLRTTSSERQPDGGDAEKQEVVLSDGGIVPGRKWIDVDLDGLRKILERRGKEFAIYELVQNAWDENARSVDIKLSRPRDGQVGTHRAR